MTLEGIPLLGSVVSPVVQLLYRMPVLNTLLAPIIGQSTIATFNADPSPLTAAGKNATAFTDKVTSFDGTQISVNYFPSFDVATGSPSTQSPTILDGPGLATAGDTNPNGVGRRRHRPGPGDSPLTGGGFNVVTWDPRGEFASGGVLQIDNPFYEGRDVSSIITWLSSAGSTDGVDNPASAQVKTGAAIGGYTNPAVVGMVGLSYGGGIQNVTAGTDPRIKAIVPALVVELAEQLAVPRRRLQDRLRLVADAGSGDDGGADQHPDLRQPSCWGTCWASSPKASRRVLGSSGPTSLINNIKAPTLYPAGHRRRAVPAAAGRHQRRDAQQPTA